MGTWTTTPRTWVAGEVPTATHFNENLRDFGRAFADAWTSYTPTLTASTTNPTGWTQTGYYMQVGKLVVAKFVVTAGASFTAGSGTYQIRLPVNANLTVGDLEVCFLRINWSGGSGYGHAYLVTGQPTYIRMGYRSSLTALANITNAAPGTWASGSFIRGTIVYEAT